MSSLCKRNSELTLRHISHTSKAFKSCARIYRPSVGLVFAKTGSINTGTAGPNKHIATTVHKLVDHNQFTVKSGGVGVDQRAGVVDPQVCRGVL